MSLLVERGSIDCFTASPLRRWGKGVWGLKRVGGKFKAAKLQLEPSKKSCMEETVIMIMISH